MPFIPGYNNGGNLDNMALSLNATHSHPLLTEYNVHNLFGHMMTNYTQAFLQNKIYNSENFNNRAFILSRSTFAGSGQHASHWLGDNWRSWAYMRYSIAGVMNMNMFGVPHAGADICGFFGNTTINPDGS